MFFAYNDIFDGGRGFEYAQWILTAKKRINN